MGILTDAVAEVAAKRGPVCSVQSLRLSLSDDDRAEFDSLVANNAIPRTTIAAAVEKVWERKISPPALNRHSRRICSCPR